MVVWCFTHLPTMTARQQGTTTNGHAMKMVNRFFLFAQHIHTLVPICLSHLIYPHKKVLKEHRLLSWLQGFASNQCPSISNLHNRVMHKHIHVCVFR